VRTRRPTHLTTTLVVAAIVCVAGALGAPATVASAAGPRCPRGTLDAVTTAYGNLFTRSTALTPDERAANLAGADDPALRALLDTWLATPEPSTTSLTVKGVQCPSRSQAVVDADLVLAGVPLPGVLPPSRAVRDGGTWKVARSTFCYRMVLENPALATTGPCARRRR
jgi:hypothetical protein